MNERASRAFRDYARLGLCGSCSALEIICKIRGICNDESGLDMLAVFDTLRLLEASGESDALKAVRAIYFQTATDRIRANEISLRIIRLSDELHCDERTIYRKLARVRAMWQTLRHASSADTLGSRAILSKILSAKE
jgi:hypothetical protein